MYTFLLKEKTLTGVILLMEAIQKGASRIVDEDIGVFASKYRRRLQCPVIGITGSFLKQQPKICCSRCCLSLNGACHPIHNQNNEIGCLLRCCVDASTDVAIVEMGMRQR